MIVIVEDEIFNITFEDLSIISDLKWLISLLGGRTLHIMAGESKKEKGEARFWVPDKYKSHMINHLKELRFSVIEGEVKKSDPNI